MTDGMTEERKDGIKTGKAWAEWLPGTGQQIELFDLPITVEGTVADAVAAAHPKHRPDGPDCLRVSLRDRQGQVLVFQTTFAPGAEVGRVRCIIAGELVEIVLPIIPADAWQAWADRVTKRNAALDQAPNLPIHAAEAPALTGTPKLIRADFFHAPGRLFDTPRNAEKQGDLPAIDRWYEQTVFTRTCAMAAAALTKMDTRDAILDWQSATVAEVEDLVFCRSEEGTLAHGQHRFDILKAFEALRAIPVPIVKIDWKQIGTDRNPRFVKEYKLRVGSLLQSYGAVFVEKKTGKRVFASDPGRKKDKVKAKADRRKKTRDLVAENIADGILESFPPDRFTLTGFEWRWNTDIAEDFICPQVALDAKDRPRRGLKGRPHIEGSRFIKLNRRYFAVMKHLREAGSIYGPRLLDLIVSEKTHITSRGKGAVIIEIQADKVVKWLNLWTEYQERPKHVLEDHVAAAVMALIKEKVMLPESWLVPQIDANPDRRKSPFYRWKVADLWSTVALIPSDEAKEIEEELVKEAEADEAARSQPAPVAQAETDQTVLPGIDTPSTLIPSGADIRAAREAAGLNLRRFAEAMAGPDFSTWSRYESGKPIRVGSIPADVWQRVRDFIVQQSTTPPSPAPARLPGTEL